MSRRMLIGDFLLRRLAEIGTTHVFGVPGDYNMSFLDQLEAFPGIEWVGTCNELNGAYAADGHARSGRPGVLLTTYAVGCLSALNGVAGAYCEHVPLIHVSGSPPVHAVDDRVALHHSLLDGGYRNIHRAFTEFTACAETISTANAVEVIDHALRTAFQTRRPVRLELPSDLTHVDVEVPDEALTLHSTPASGSQVEAAAAAVAAALGAAARPLLLFDLPAIRWGALAAIESFCAAINIPFAATMPAVHHASGPGYLGMLPSASTDVQEIYAEADLVIACGFTTSDVTTGGFAMDVDDKDVVRLQPTYTQLGGRHPNRREVFYGTEIGAVLDRVREAAVARPRWWSTPTAPVARHAAAAADAAITEEFFFDRLGSFVRTGDVLIAETGTSAQNTVGLTLPDGVDYVNQSSWGSIGYALPALLGAQLGAPERRHVLCTGDGSLQLTVQELSTVIRHGLAPVIFVLDNHGYTIERSILGATAGYNDVASWAYGDLARVFGIDESRYLNRRCSTRAELDAALAEAAQTTSLTVVEVELQPLDMTAPTLGVGAATRRFDYGVNGPADDS